jgi:extracellular factor (EF) 3-hydroxypalmitic acid methyl ester biosynthesis protein
MIASFPSESDFPGASRAPFDASSSPQTREGSLEDRFDWLGENRMADFLHFSKVFDYSAGEQVVLGGAESRCLYYVETGSVEVSYRVADTPIVVALIGPSNFFGETGFFDGVSRVRDIRATEDSVIRLFDGDSITRMREQDAALYGDFVAVMARSICEKFRRVVEEREPVTAYAASLSGGRGSFEEVKPIPQHLVQTEEWRFSNRLIEEFKMSFFDLSYQLQKDTSDEVPQPLRDRCRQVMDDFNGQLQKAATLLKETEAANYAWGYAFKEIFPYFMRSRFAERAYYKPSGYAGDHVMMEMIYANQPDGDGKLGRLMDGWCLDSSAARAVRGRREFLKKQLETLCGKKSENREAIRIMNLACGSNRELFDFLADCAYTEKISALCIDADPRALEYTHRYINTFAHKASVKLMNDNVVHWAIGRVRHNFGLQDIIYSAGLTDYLDDRILAALINRSYECLEEEGTLIIGNFGYENNNKAFLDYILQWRLTHRSEDDLLRIFSKTRFGEHVEVMAEENGVNLFAVATKVH